MLISRHSAVNPPITVISGKLPDALLTSGITTSVVGVGIAMPQPQFPAVNQSVLIVPVQDPATQMSDPNVKLPEACCEELVTEPEAETLPDVALLPQSPHHELPGSHKATLTFPMGVIPQAPPVQKSWVVRFELPTGWSIVQYPQVLM